MSESVGCKQAPTKRREPPEDESGPTRKRTKVTDTSNEKPSTSQSCTSKEVERKETTGNGAITVGQGEPSSAKPDQTETHTSGTVEAHSSDLPGSINARGDGGGHECPPTSMDQSDDSAAIAAAEALASLTAGAGEDSKKTSSSSNKVKRDERESKVKVGVRDSLKQSLKTLAAAADSSTSVHSVARGDVEDIPDTEEEDPGTTPASSSTPSSSLPSDNEDDEEDGECAIVSVKMAPEIGQSVALLAQVQMRLETLEKKSVRLHQRLDMKMNRQRRPHLDQRRTITQSIPGFWVTALLNHPHLSAHIDETDEDALSYMIDLEIESFKNSKLGSRIRFHFRRNPYFQNNIIMKEVHLGMGGSPVSFSNPILWHRGQNLMVHSDPRNGDGVYQTFFSWFSDHSNPGRDDIAQILKDDLYRDPLRYYLTPLWEPRENGSSASGARAADNSNGGDCVVISDSDDDDDDDDDEEVQSDTGVGHREEEEEEEEEGEEGEEGEDKGQGSDYSDQEHDEEESFGDKDEDVYVEDVEESPGDPKAKDQEVEEDIDVDEEGDEEDESKD